MSELLRTCLMVFFARIGDVTIGTTRTIFMVNGKKYIAAMLGFIEVLIWFTVVREALNSDLTSFWIPLSYASGFASGNLIGGFISEKLIKDKYSVKVVTSNRNMKTINTLRKAGYAVTVTESFGINNAPKWLLYLEIQDTKLKDLKALIYRLDKNAFVSVNKSKAVYKGFFGVVK